jgi:predicted DNA-binding protein with PD1-like motif
MTRFLLLFTALIQLAACTSPKPVSEMTVYAIRLSPGQDIKKELTAFVREKNLHAAFIITCVGSLQQAVLRLANQPNALTRVEKFEIVSLTGTLSPDGAHLHIALSDSIGTTIGGHLLEGSLIYTTAEIVIGEAETLSFKRETDPATTYKELKVYKRE